LSKSFVLFDLLGLTPVIQSFENPSQHKKVKAQTRQSWLTDGRTNPKLAWPLCLAHRKQALQKVVCV